MYYVETVGTKSSMSGLRCLSRIKIKIALSSYPVLAQTVDLTKHQEQFSKGLKVNNFRINFPLSFTNKSLPDLYANRMMEDGKEY